MMMVLGLFKILSGVCIQFGRQVSVPPPPGTSHRITNSHRSPFGDLAGLFGFIKAWWVQVLAAVGSTHQLNRDRPAEGDSLTWRDGFLRLSLLDTLTYRYLRTPYAFLLHRTSSRFFPHKVPPHCIPKYALRKIIK